MTNSIVLIDSTVGITTNLKSQRETMVAGGIKHNVATPLKYFNINGATRLNHKQSITMKPKVVWSNKANGYTLLEPLKINSSEVNPLRYSDYPLEQDNKSYESFSINNGYTLVLDQVTYSINHWDILFKGLDIWTIKNLEDNLKLSGPFYINVIPADKVPEDLAVIQPLKILVEKTRPPSFGATGSGSSVKNLKYSIQKNSFVEIFFNFEEATIISVDGLPEGLEFDFRYNKLFGTCELAGNFMVTFRMSNGNILEGAIVVTNVPRKK